MNASITIRSSGIVLLCWFLASCAATGSLVSVPDVRLTDVEVTSLDFSSQTFRLGFDVSNPNPFPLPVTRIRYGLALDGQQFAAGETAGNFVVSANGDGEFAISVELDLLKSAPQLLYTIHDGVRNAIPYALEGSLGIDIPFAKPLKFETNGEIRVRAD